MPSGRGIVVTFDSHIAPSAAACASSAAIAPARACVIGSSRT